MSGGGARSAGTPRVGSLDFRSPRGALRALLVWALASVAIVYAWTGVHSNLVVVGPGFANRIGNTAGTDFAAFYAAGVLAREGRAAALYDGTSLRATHTRLVGRHAADYPWAYPPPILLALAPLSLLPFVPALWGWLALTAGGMAAAATGLWRYPLAPLAVLFFPALTQAAVTGPTGTLSGALFVAAVASLRRRPAAGGLLLGLLAYKPQLVVLVPVCLLAGGERRALAGFAAGGLALVAASALAFGASAWLRFLTDAGGHLDHVVRQHFPWMRMPTVFVAMLHATGDWTIAAVAQGASTLAVAVLCVRVWRGTDDPFARVLALASGTFLATPYAFDYDSTLLGAPFVLLLHRVWSSGSSRGETLALVAMWLAPLVVWLGSTWLGQQIGPVLFAALMAQALASARRADDPAALAA